MAAVDALGLLAERGGYGSVRRMNARMRHLFEDIQLDGARVLDVGCGKGTFGLWTALHGATELLGIEPEVEGSTDGSLAWMRETVKLLGVGDSVRCEAEFLQAVSEGHFDVVILYNVVNHIDEGAVVNLHRGDELGAYPEVIRHLGRLLVPGGTLIVADCGRSNVWPSLGLPNPFVPDIEWHKHQNPDVWIQLFQGGGFALRDIRWSPIFPLGLLSANRAVQFITGSHFVLRFGVAD